MSPYCTVVIVNWNSWDILQQCLESLKKQTFSNFKIILIDNGSSQPVPTTFLSDNPNLTFIQNATNTGFAAANNLAISSYVDTDWVCLLNPDAFPDPDWLKKLVDATVDHPHYSMFASRQIMANKRNLLDGDGDSYHLSGLVWRTLYGKNITMSGKREIFSACGASALYRREVFLDIGGFDEDFFCYLEDVDLGFRFRLMGHHCLFIPDAVVVHAGSVTSGGKQSDFSVYHGHRNMVWTYIKNMPSFLFWLFLPLHLLMNLVSIVVFIKRGKGRVILRAKLDALLGLPKMWQKRRVIQKNRIASIYDIWRALDKRLLWGWKNR